MTARTLGPFPRVTIKGMGRAFPPRGLTTREALESVPAGSSMSPERLEHASDQLDEMLGLRTRYWSYDPGTPEPHGPNTASLGAQALARALESAGWTPCDLERLDLATSTPHRFTSTVATTVGGELGIRAPCLDVRAGCAGGMFALGNAAMHLGAGAGRVAIVGADTFSAVLPPEHRLSACVMGDGAASLLLGGGSGELLALHIDSDGADAGLVRTVGPMPPTPQAIASGGYRLSGEPEALAEKATRRYMEACERALEHAGVRPDEVSALVCHQTSAPALRGIAQELGIERAWVQGVSEHANIGAGGWISGLIGAMKTGYVTRGQVVLTAAVGGGMSWGAALWRL